MKTFGVIARLKPPAGYVGVWINIYKHGKYYQSGGLYKTKRHADNIAKPYRHDCVFTFVRKYDPPHTKP